MIAGRGFKPLTSKISGEAADVTGVRPISRLRRRRCWLVLALLGGLFPVGTSGAANLDQLQAERQHVQSGILGVRSHLATTTQTLSQLNGRLVALDNQLFAGENRLQAIDAQEHRLASQLQTTEGQLQKTRQRFSEDKTVLGLQMRGLQVRGPLNLVGVVLGATSFRQFVSEAELLGQLANAQNRQIALVAQEKEEIRRAVGILQNNRAQLGQLSAEVQVQLGGLRQDQVRRQGLVAELQLTRSQEEAYLQQLESQDSSLAEAIKTLEALKSHLSSQDLQAMILAVSQAYHVDPALITAVIDQESGGNAKAVSSVGAEGLMQLMPGTAAGLGVNDPFDPKQNLWGGVAYLSSLLKQFNGNVALALAAYNAGPGAVQKYGGIPPYQETQNYVRSILSKVKAQGGP